MFARLTYIAKRWRRLLVLLAALAILATAICIQLKNTELPDQKYRAIEESYLDNNTAANSDQKYFIITQLDHDIKAALSICTKMIGGQFSLTSIQINHLPEPNFPISTSYKNFYISLKPTSIKFYGSNSKWSLFSRTAKCDYNLVSGQAIGFTEPGGLDLLGEYKSYSYSPNKP